MAAPVVMVLAAIYGLGHQGLGDSLSLRDALARARTERAQVKAAGAGVAAARAGVRVAGTIPNPVASYSYTDDPPRQHASLDQSLDWLLTRGADRSAAQSQVRRALADSLRGAAELAAEVREAFYGTLAAAELERVTDEQGLVADSLVRIADRRVAAGDIAELERSQLVLEAARAAQRRSRAREAAGVAWARLARAIAWPSSTSRPALAGRLDDGLPAAPLADLTDTTSLRSPVIEAAVADSEAGEERARRMSLARVPLPSVVAGADWDDPGGQRGALAVLGISLPLPLWQRGGGALAQARAEAARAAAATAEARLDVRRDLAEAATRLNEAAGRARTARDSLLPVARRIRERATVAYQAGETGLIPLLEALRAERDVTAEAVDDLLAFQEALAGWKRTLGEAE